MPSLDTTTNHPLGKPYDIGTSRCTRFLSTSSSWNKGIIIIMLELLVSIILRIYPWLLWAKRRVVSGLRSARYLPKALVGRFPPAPAALVDHFAVFFCPRLLLLLLPLFSILYLHSFSSTARCRSPFIFPLLLFLYFSFPPCDLIFCPRGPRIGKVRYDLLTEALHSADFPVDQLKSLISSPFKGLLLLGYKVVGEREVNKSKERAQ